MFGKNGYSSIAVLISSGYMFLTIRVNLIIFVKYFLRLNIVAPFVYFDCL